MSDIRWGGLRQLFNRAYRFVDVILDLKLRNKQLLNHTRAVDHVGYATRQNAHASGYTIQPMDIPALITQ